MAAKLYTTKQNETVDFAAWRHYGKTQEVTELVLEANPQIVDMGPVLPFGTVLAMPVVETATTIPKMTKLWD